MSRVIYSKHEAGQGSLKTYVIGFILSIILTLTAFSFVYIHGHSGHEVFSHHLLIPLIISLAVVQLFVQLGFFLHVGRESKPRWNFLALIFALIVVLILVIGSLWIISNLNYHMTPSHQQVDQYLKGQDGL